MVRQGLVSKAKQIGRTLHNLLVRQVLGGLARQTGRTLHNLMVRQGFVARAERSLVSGP